MLRNNKGAASVLVIVMMLVLVVFGLAMVTTALAQSRLSDSHETWVIDYYELEQEAQMMIADIDRILYQTEMEVVNYLKVGDILSEDYDGPIVNHFEYQDGFMDEDSRTGQNQYLSQMFPEIYMEQLKENLDMFSLEHSDIVVDITNRMSGFPEIIVSGSVSNQVEDYQKHIYFEMVPTVPAYVLSYDGVRIDGYKDLTVTDRYQLKAYVQQQEAFEVEESIEFENPF